MTGILALSMGANADSGGQENARQASIQFLSAAPVDMDWIGLGDVQSTQRFCVKSTTGRFEIFVTSTSGQGLSGESGLPYEVSIEFNGVRTTETVSSASPSFRFEGETPLSASCDSLSTGKLTVRILQNDALKAVSGRFNDELLVSVNPL